MKKNKTLLKLSSLSWIALFLFACQKYEDGPMFSLRTRTQRISNTWKIDNYTVNDLDVTSLSGGYTEMFSKDGNYSYNWGLLNGTGTWKFTNNDANIALTGTSNQDNHTLIILKLEEKQFWYYFVDGSDKHVFHMVEN